MNWMPAAHRKVIVAAAVRVADFGLAKPVKLESDTTLTQTGFIVGTPHYISPQQAEGEDIDFHADFWTDSITERRSTLTT